MASLTRRIWTMTTMACLIWWTASLSIRPLLLSAEQVSEIKDESGTGSIVITTGLAAPSASNLSLADGIFDSQAGRGSRRVSLMPMGPP